MSRVYDIHTVGRPGLLILEFEKSTGEIVNSPKKKGGGNQLLSESVYQAHYLAWVQDGSSVSPRLC